MRADVDRPEVAGMVDVVQEAVVDDDDGTALAQNRVHPFGRHSRFQRNIRRAGFQHREYRDDVIGPRDSVMATGVSTPTPRAASAPAKRLAAVSSSR